MTEFIEVQKALFPDLAAEYEQLGSLYTQKLWHQLSLSLETFLVDKKNHRENNIFELYSEFIAKFDTKINQVRLAQILSIIAHSFNDPARALEFLLSVCPPIIGEEGKSTNPRSRMGKEASICIDMDIVLMYLQLGQMSEAKTMLETSKEKLSAINSTETIVFSKVHWSFAEYYKMTGPPQEFYKAALMFLAYTPIEDLSQERKYILATDMALASITGEDIFNFGEVIATPILSVLKDTPNQWIHDLVFALNQGDIDAFNSIVDVHREKYMAQPALASRQENVKQKVVLLSLMNIAFERPSHDRLIAFADIASRTRIPIDQVEWVLMRAMSLGLLKGLIDEVEQVVSISWVQPRVLDKDQIALMVKQLEGWTERVRTTLHAVEDQTPELLFH